MKINIILVIIVPIITLAAGSDMMKSELLTDFEIDTFHQNGNLMLNIKNIGLIQSNHALLTVYANGTLGDFIDECPEGVMTYADTATMAIITFQRMSPGMSCLFDIDIKNGTNIIDKLLTADGRITTWSESSTYWSWLVTGIVVLIIIEILTIWYASKLPIMKLIFFVMLKLRGKSYEDSKHVEKVCSYVRNEYGISINNQDATIIEMIFCGKDTKGQLVKNTNLPISYVNYRIKKMRQDEIISKDVLKIDDTLHKYLESIYANSYK